MSIVALNRIKPMHELSIQERNDMDNTINRCVSHNTRRSYSSDVNHYLASGGKLPADRDMLVGYLNAYKEKLKATTLTRRIKGISRWHIEHGYADPSTNIKVVNILKGIRRQFISRSKKANPFLSEHIKAIKEMCDSYNKLADCRNLAIITVGVGLALRCSELVNLRVEDLTFSNKGVKVYIPYSKTDQEGQGSTKALTYVDIGICPVKCLEAWLKRSGITSGYIFRPFTSNGRILDQKMNSCSLNMLIKQIAQDAYLPHPEGFSGHSMRRGFVTIGVLKEVPLPELADHGRWQDINTMMGYYGDNNPFTNNLTSTIFS